MSDQQVFKALSDPTRRAILKALSQGPMPAGDLAEGFDISKPSMSHHFNVLKNAGLVATFREGQSIIYRINASVLEDATRFMLDIMRFGDEGAEIVEKTNG